MKSYVIYHAINMFKNDNIVKPKTEYNAVGYVDAKNENCVFHLTNNIISHWNVISPTRSTSVGDIYHCTTDDSWWLVKGIGIENVTDTIRENWSIEVAE
jgi:hypothetical protein